MLRIILSITALFSLIEIARSEEESVAKWIVNSPPDFHNRTVNIIGMVDVRNDTKQMDEFVKLTDYFLPRTDGFTDGEVVDALEHYFWGQKHGLAMELGALDGSPKTRSMTCEYEKSLGWRRILVEGDPSYRGDMIALSPLAFSVNAAICEHHRTVHFSNQGYTGGIVEFMSEQFLKDYHKHIYTAGTPNGNISSIDWTKLPTQVREVECIPLHTVLHKAKVRHVNLFILDVEGGEYEVLKSISWGTVRFDVLCIETDPPNRPEGYSQQLTNYLSTKGYINHSGQVGRNIWFIHKEFVPFTRPGLSPTCFSGALKSEHAERWYANRRTPAYQRCPMSG